MQAIAKHPTIIFNTSGTGLWSGDIKPVTITNITIDYIDDERDFGELRVYFDTTTWNTDDSGLIYTDRQFMKELQQFLDSHGLPGKDVSYSEQGMQGDDYVSCDIGKPFIDAWASKFNLDLDQYMAEQDARFQAQTEKFLAKLK